MFEARLAQGAVLKKVLDSVKDLVTDANFEADPTDGFKLQAMDSSHVSLVSLKLHPDGFEHYRCDRPLTMGMNLMNMVRRGDYFLFGVYASSFARVLGRVARGGAVKSTRARGSASSRCDVDLGNALDARARVGVCGRVGVCACVGFMHRASRVRASTRGRGRGCANGCARD